MNFENTLIYVIVVFVVSIILALLMHELIEVPMIKFSKNIKKNKNEKKKISQKNIKKMSNL